MKGKVIGGIVIVTVVLAIWSHVALDGNADPEALTTIAGCYAAPGQPLVKVAGSGTLSFGRQIVQAGGYRDKQGISLLPQKRITIDRHDHDRLGVDPVSPVPLRFDEGEKRLEVPDFHLGRSVYFDRADCA